MQIRISFRRLASHATEMLARVIPVALKTAKPGTPEFREAIRQAFVSEHEIAASHGVYNFTDKDRNGVDDRARDEEAEARSDARLRGEAALEKAAHRLLTDARPGMRVVDFCAGAGGKTLALAAGMANRGKLVACDVSARRLERAVRRLRRTRSSDELDSQSPAPRSQRAWPQREPSLRRTQGNA